MPPRPPARRRRPRKGMRRPPRATPRRPPPVDRYALHLDDAELEALTDAVCPESVALKCWELLRWRREGHRNDARAVPPPRRE